MSLSKVMSAEVVNCNFLYFCLTKNYHYEIIKKNNWRQRSSLCQHRQTTGYRSL